MTVPKIQSAYDDLREEGDPPTFEEFATSKDPLLLARAGMRIATRLIDNPTTGGRINNMSWEVLDLTASNISLLTSDRAVEQVHGLGDPRAFLTLPIGPKRLFIAANQRTTIDHLARAKPRDLVRLRNRSTVSLAREFVWAADRSQARFIEDNFASLQAPTLGERLAAMPVRA